MSGVDLARRGGVRDPRPPGFRGKCAARATRQEKTADISGTELSLGETRDPPPESHGAKSAGEVSGKLPREPHLESTDAAARDGTALPGAGSHPGRAHASGAGETDDDERSRPLPTVDGIPTDGAGAPPGGVTTEPSRSPRDGGPSSGAHRGESSGERRRSAPAESSGRATRGSSPRPERGLGGLREGSRLSSAPQAASEPHGGDETRDSATEGLSSGADGVEGSDAVGSGRGQAEGNGAVREGTGSVSPAAMPRLDEKLRGGMVRGTRDRRECLLFLGGSAPVSRPPVSSKDPASDVSSPTT